MGFPGPPSRSEVTIPTELSEYNIEICVLLLVLSLTFFYYIQYQYLLHTMRVYLSDDNVLCDKGATKRKGREQRGGIAERTEWSKIAICCALDSAIWSE